MNQKNTPEPSIIFIYQMGFNFYKLLKTFSRTEQLIFAGAALVFVVTGVVYAASFVDTKTVLEPTGGGTYLEGMVAQPVYVNPVIQSGSDADKDLIALTYSTVADLADKIIVSPNHLVWTIRLKDNVYWHDGVRLTADDVIFTLEAIENPEANSPLFTTWQGVRSERVSELEFTLATGEPYAFFEQNLKNLYVAPKHIFREVPVGNWRQSDYALTPIGSGPYKAAGFKKEKNGFVSEYYLTKNDRYFKDKPFIDNITFVFFVNEIDALQAFAIARIDGLGGVNPLLLPDVKRPHTVGELHLPRYYAVFLNQSANDFLKNSAVRRALDYATDKKTIIKQVFNGSATSLDGPTPYLSSVTLANSTPYDPSQAKTILDGAKLPKGDDGFFGEIKLVVPSLEFLTKTAEILKANWESVGIKTTLITLDLPTISNDAIKTRNYDAILFGNIFATNQDMFSFWHSSERFYPGLNLSLYNNKSADKLMESIRKDFEEAGRAAKLVDLVAQIRNDQPAIFLYSPNYIYLTNNQIHGVVGTAINTPASRFQNIAKWYIKTKRVFR
ncbi:MAG: peptide ABC transporter substrate-binding protein [bacterium]|nr:peptide ABC transporter substrate-binding protein [bacterium]